MADTTEEDSKVVQYLDLLIVALIVLIAGLVIHSFIIGVNVTDWWKGRSVTPVDHIVTSLGISRMCIQCADTLYLLTVMFFQCIPDLHVILFCIGAVYSFSTYANIWLTSLLSIVLCLKISNLHTRLFLYLRRMILHRTLHLIAASLLLTVLNGLVHMWSDVTKVTNGETYNTTMANLFRGCIFMNSIYTFTIGSFIPLLFCSISSVLLFTSLYHHTTRMKMSSNLSINLETYYSAMRFVSFTFIYNTMYYIGYFTSTFYYYMYCVNHPWLHMFLGFLPALHSFYLIYRTVKYRSPLSKILHNVVDFLFRRKDEETTAERT